MDDEIYARCFASLLQTHMSEPEYTSFVAVLELLDHNYQRKVQAILFTRDLEF